MPDAPDPATRPAQDSGGIYIARGADTLGPYNPAEAAALVVGGYLHPDDHAARNGDAAWVPLAEFLPRSLPPRPVPAAGPVAAPVSSAPAAPAVSPVSPALPASGRRNGWFAGALLIVAAVGVAVGLTLRHDERREAGPATPAASNPTASSPATSAPGASVPPAASSPGVVPTTAPTATMATAPVSMAPTPAPSPAPDGPLRGSLMLGAASDPHPASPAGVGVMAYPLDSLESALAPVVAAAGAARERLDPQIEAASAEYTRRQAEEQDAFKALSEAGASDPLRRSLRFAYSGAKTATRTAADNQRFLREERAAAAGADVLFRALPAPTATALTDGAGNFTLDLPADGRAYAVAAAAPAPADEGDARLRRWIVRLTPAQRSGHAPLRLDDTNALSSDSDASLFHPAD